ncbi:hypothetical protein E8E15_001615 [Penicillium rubens]|nr:hypothetical protein E8E15_001615 [Penicillium rubens]
MGNYLNEWMHEFSHQDQTKFSWRIVSSNRSIFWILRYKGIVNVIEEGMQGH